MIRRITLENYMSHARTVIEPAQGLTVLVGPNNCGKSAVVSALQTLCGDNAGDFMVRHGERVCKVTVETDDGHEITWRRKGAAVSYVIDDNEIHRSGRGNLPDNLHDHLRLAKVEARGTGDKFDVHFALQKSPIFLIDNESRAAAFFSTSSDAERLLEVQKLHKAKTADANSRQKLLSAELARLDKELESLSPIDAVNAALADAEKAYDDLVAGSSEIDARARVCDLIKKCERRLALHQLRCHALRPLTPPPDLSDAAALEMAIVCLAGARDAVVGLRRRSRTLGLLQPPPALQDEQPLERLCGRLATAAARIGRERGKTSSLSALQDPPTITPTAPLENTISLLERAARTERGARRHRTVVAAIKPPPEEADPAPLDRFIQRFTQAHASATALRGRLDQVSAELNNVTGQVRAWLQNNPTCPLCGGATDLEHVLAGGHHHG